jgi:hypothetical protein
MLCKVGPTLLDDKPSQEARMKKRSSSQKQAALQKAFLP